MMANTRFSPLSFCRHAMPRLLAGVLLGCVPLLAPASDVFETDRMATGWITAWLIPPSVSAEFGNDNSPAGRGLDTLPDLQRLYLARNYTPIWARVAGLTTEGKQLYQSLQNSWQDGLNPANYRLGEINGLLEQSSDNVDKRMELELLLSHAYLQYSRDLQQGRLNPRKVAPTDWLIFGEHDSDRVNDLLAALDKNQFSELLASLPPPHPNYQRLRDGMKALRQMEANGGWPQILPTGDKLEPGKSNPEIPLLRARLLRGGELPFCQWKRLMNHAACWWDWQAMGKLDSRQYDSPLAEAVRAFQHRHSIEADGVIGPATRQALNVPVGQRIRQLAANMERWRWLPRDFGPRYIMVNVAGFLLGVFENNQQIDQMAVIVGTAYRKTPAFRSEMEQIVFNPRWNVPYRNATEDLLPRLKKDASKVAREGFRAFAGKQEVSVDSIDWSQYSKRNFPYHLQQRPGKHNALGQIKFVFPNHFAVYMHDTPKRHLFKKAVRNFSSGCVRLEEPLELAEYVLKNPDKWTQEGIQQAIDAGKTRHVSLPEKVPVYILYWTAWVEDNGVLHFSEDIYKRDPPILNALEAGGDMPGNLPPPDALIANQDGGAG